MAPSNNGNGPLNDESRALMSGKMGPEIGAMVSNGEVSADAAGAFLLERAIRKATNKGLIAAAA